MPSYVCVGFSIAISENDSLVDPAVPNSNVATNAFCCGRSLKTKRACASEAAQSSSSEILRATRRLQNRFRTRSAHRKLRRPRSRQRIFSFLRGAGSVPKRPTPTLHDVIHVGSSRVGFWAIRFWLLQGLPFLNLFIFKSLCIDCTGCVWSCV